MLNQLRPDQQKDTTTIFSVLSITLVYYQDLIDNFPQGVNVGSLFLLEGSISLLKKKKASRYVGTPDHFLETRNPQLKGEFLIC